MGVWEEMREQRGESPGWTGKDTVYNTGWMGDGSSSNDEDRYLLAAGADPTNSVDRAVAWGLGGGLNGAMGAAVLRRDREG